jgi:hypothetical protein
MQLRQAVYADKMRSRAWRRHQRGADTDSSGLPIAGGNFIYQWN